MYNQIYNIDCLEGMKDIPDNSVDCIISDLPFGITDQSFDKKKFNLVAMWEQFKRILKNYSAVALFASSKFSYELFNSNPKWYKYKWIWLKNYATCFQHAKNQPMHKFEEILIFSDGVIAHESCTNKRMKYFPQGVKKIKPKIFLAKNKSGKCYGAGLNNSHVRNFVDYPVDVLFFDAHINGKSHPNEKPTDLLEYLIKTYTNEGEIVLDATIGSGSTAVAAINTGRKFIGFETDAHYFEVAQRRIAEAQAKKAQELFDSTAIECEVIG